jgi:hypothetical protein
MKNFLSFMRTSSEPIQPFLVHFAFFGRI